jgi:hypothetical protein
VVLALTAWPLIAIALRLQPEMSLLSAPVAMIIVSGFVLFEATLFVVIQFLFRKLT